MDPSLSTLLDELAWAAPRTMGIFAALIRETSGRVPVKLKEEAKVSVMQRPVEMDKSFCRDFVTDLLAPYPAAPQAGVI